MFNFFLNISVFLKKPLCGAFIIQWLQSLFLLIEHAFWGANMQGRGEDGLINQNYLLTTSGVMRASVI